MKQILKISEAATIGLHAMVLLANYPERLLSNGTIAEVLKVSDAHLAKVMQRLGRANLVTSLRGPKGGFKLKKPADKITLLDVFEAVEGKLEKHTCLFDSPLCGEGGCILGGLLDEVHERFLEFMSSRTIADQTDAYSCLEVA